MNVAVYLTVTVDLSAMTSVAAAAGTFWTIPWRDSIRS